MRRLFGFLVAPLIMLGFTAIPAQATTITFDLNNTFSGTSPSGSPPWLTLMFDDVGGIVRLTATANLQSTSEFIGAVYFNYNWEGASASDLDVAFFSGTGQTATGLVIDKDVDNVTNPNLRADGDGNFDVRLDFPEAFGDDRFMGNDVAVFDLTCTSCSSFSANSFNVLSATGGGNGIFHAAAHVQGIGEGAELSGWIGDTPIPEPTTLLLFGTGLLALGHRFRSRKRHEG